MTDSLGAILHKQPDWERLPTETPPNVRLLLSRCLTKDRKRRFRDIGDVKIELEAAIADPTSSVLGLSSAALATSGKSLLWSSRGVSAIAIAVTLTALAAFGVGWSFWPKPPVVETRPPAPIERFTITLPQRESTTNVDGYATFDVTNNGSALAYMVKKEPSGVDIFLRSRDQAVPVNIATSDNSKGIRLPTLSPDGKWLAY